MVILKQKNMMRVDYAIAKSLCGISHNSNEDSVLLTKIGKHALLVAVSDGHGSEKCFRSQNGSRFAVKALENIFQTMPYTKNIDAAKLTIELLPLMIVQQWKKLVDEDLEYYPYSSTEQSVECMENHYLPYGCTLLGCYITHQYGIFIQIGDGDMFALFDENGSVTKKIVSEDERLTGLETTSLCLPDAENDFRISVIDFTENRLKVIILGTDGVGNSYSSDVDLFAWASDINDFMSQENGRDMINENLSKWLNEVSVNGSGDDISMAIIVMEQDAPLTTEPELHRGCIRKFVSNLFQSKNTIKPVKN